MQTTDLPLTRVMALHALAYCERLFYLEEVEEIRVADANVYAGRRLHEELAEDETLETYQIESAELGLIGKLDAIKKRDGETYPYEHKKGRSNDGQAWNSDRLQVGAYAMLLESAIGHPVTQARVRYHKDNKTAILTVDDRLRQDVRDAIRRGHELRERTTRPPITTNERLCVACSLSPVCLPEENRKIDDESYESIRLFPPNREKQTIHLLAHGDRVGRSGETLKITPRDGAETVLPIEDIEEIVLHGYAQVSTQAIALCAYKNIPIHWISAGGNYLCTLNSGTGRVQRRIAQYEYMSKPENQLSLAKRTVENRMNNQIQVVLRQSRGDKPLRQSLTKHVRQMRKLKSNVKEASCADSLRGYEGACANTYFDALKRILADKVPEEFRFEKRSRRPPQDRFNAILSFGYSLLYKEVMSAVLVVGLEPSLGYYHRPRSSAYPLALDVMELFRVPIWDIPVLASLSKKIWHPADDFLITPDKVWLSDNGRKKAIELFENRLNDTWKHPKLDYSLSYKRHVELEVRLLEKVWMDGKDLFASTVLR